MEPPPAELASVAPAAPAGSGAETESPGHRTEEHPRRPQRGFLIVTPPSSLYHTDFALDRTAPHMLLTHWRRSTDDMTQVTKRSLS